MGNCLPSSAVAPAHDLNLEELKQQKEKNEQIERELKANKQALKNEVKMLLLGTGESGKSTILKQMQIIHGTGYSDDERLSYRDIVFSNIIQSMKVLLDAVEVLGIEYQSENEDSQTTTISINCIKQLPQQLEHQSSLSKEIVDALQHLWSHSSIQAAYERRREFQLNDSAQYFFNNLVRICADGYVPTDQDILRSRVKTTGITETTFQIEKLLYRMFDVGGQRSERKKWIHCFEGVTAVIFLAALSEFDQVLVEDGEVGRVREALVLFESICNSKWFVRTSMILFLNKIDLFKEKLEFANKKEAALKESGEDPSSTDPPTTVGLLKDYFPEYQGPNEYEPASQFLLQKFVELNKQPDTKQIYAHFTCATDTAQIKFVMAAVTDIIIQNNLRDTGLM